MSHLEGKRPLWHKSTGIIILLIWGVFGLYLYQLDGQSLWRDEILSVGRANQSLRQIMTNINIVTDVVSPDLHPPFYFLILTVWQRIVGETEFAYRYVSVLMGVLAIPLFYACGKRIWGRSSGVWTAVFVTLSPFYLWYAQEARMYALLVVESLLVIYTLWPLLFPSPRKRDYLYFGTAIFFAIYTHYTAVFLLGFSLMAIILAQGYCYRHQWRLLRRFLIVVGLVFVAIVLVAIPLWPNLSTLLTANGFIAFGRPSLWWLARSGINTFTQGSTNPPDISLLQMLPFLILALVGAFSVGVKNRWQATLISAGGFLGVLVLFYIASFIQANYSNPRHLLLLSPFLFLLMGHGFVTMVAHRKVTAVIIGGAALVLSLSSLHQTVTNPPVVRDDVRALAAFIEERAKPGDSVIWHNAVMSMLYDYYQSDLPMAVIPRYGQSDESVVLEELTTWQEDSERIWFVRHPSPPFFANSVVYEALNETMVSSDGATFPASWAILSVELFQPIRAVGSLPEGTLLVDLTKGDYSVKGLFIDPVTTNDEGVWATLYWQLEGSIAADSPKVCIQILELDGLVWSDSCTFLQLPTEAETYNNQLLAQDVWLQVAQGLAPVPYNITIMLDGETEAIGTLQPKRPLTATPLAPIIEYENGLNLIEVNWLDQQFRAGFWVLGDLLWQVADSPQEELTLQAKLVDRMGRVVAQETMPIMASNFPEQAWQQGDLIRTRLAVPIPYRINGRYRLQISLNDEDDSPIRTKTWPVARVWKTLDTVTIEDWPLTKTVAEDSFPMKDTVLFGEEIIELVGYNLAREEDDLQITLYWRNLVEQDENYGTFIHIGQVGDPPIVQGGGPDWERPTQSWRKDEVISQTFTIMLPEDAIDSSTVVQVGLYATDNSDSRLPMRINGIESTNNIYLLDAIPK